ncbi:MBL fold metallo-hydrolase [Roseomonas cutis]|uniref:MBL fold metallo-hydrolase n=1 Tax=Roseomonas cutis TaxID=2897332 RepID=UPI00272AB562|nr:MBL fold metallo-hydrolase [Roseomonas sp. OT10]
MTSDASGLRGAVVPVTPFHQNCLILWDEATKRGAVIDPGEAAPVLAALEQLGVTAEKVVLTHGHLDHASGAAELAERLGIPVEGPHEADRFLLDGLPEAAAKYGFPARAVTPDRWLSEGDTVEIAGRPFAVLHVPGHTPGHLVFFDAAQRLALVGDVLFRGSVGRSDFPYGDGPGLIEGIRGKLFPLGDDVQFHCGHGPGGTLGEERRTNPYAGEAAR